MKRPKAAKKCTISAPAKQLIWHKLKNWGYSNLSREAGIENVDIWLKEANGHAVYFGIASGSRSISAAQ